MLIRDLLKHIETFAPLSLALDWDNVGLLVGDPNRAARNALIALDITSATVDYAIKTGADIIISHHPLIFQPLKKLNDPLLLRLIEHKLAAICLHTNLDVAPGGVNHALAQQLDFEIIDQLSSESCGKWYHLAVSVPSEHSDAVLAAAIDAGAGRIGSYDSCSTRSSVEGSFRPLPGSEPFSGKAGKLSHVPEELLELMVDAAVLSSVQIAIRKAHPYETPLLYWFPVSNPNPAYALGLICKAKKPLSLQELARHVKASLSCPDLTLWKADQAPDTMINRIAICGGAGNSLIPEAARKAEVFISGDITYHNLLDSPIPIIDAGHFYTEYPVLKRLAAEFGGIGLDCETLPLDKHDLPRKLARIID
ncbi:MAG: Nif3-like dinuclear metal center hexameric protein [Candidatus Cloacimonadaceae bacterium]|nr:Nif3-like dinuclear metal center hexameric protein [Candidatus Cloacimonadaceae bacterium]